MNVALLAASACVDAESRAEVVAPPSPDVPPLVGPVAVAVAPPAPKPVPFEIPRGFRPVIDRPALVATTGGRQLLLRWLDQCHHVPGPSGTVTLPKLGTGTYTPPGSGMTSCDRYIEALDRDGASVWHAKAIDGYHYWTVLGDRLLASGPRKVALLDAASGEISSVQDPVLGREACFDAAHERVFVSDWDDHAKDAVVDLATMQVRPKQAAERCPTRPYSDCDEHTAIACREHRDERLAPSVPVAGFWESGTLHSPDGDVLYGHQTAGRKLPMLVAIDRVRHVKRWSVIVPPQEFQGSAAEANVFSNYTDVANGKVFVEYDQWTSHPHLAAFDLKDGARLWDVPIDALTAFTPTADRVYLTSQNGMRVLDASTGTVRDPS